MAVKFQVRPILPRQSNYPENIAALLEKEIEAVLRGYVGPKLAQAMYRRQYGWKQKVNIVSTYSARARLGRYTGASMYVRPFGQNKRIWVFVSGGVARHPISPRRKKFLFIHGGQGGYSPKTRPGNVYGMSSNYEESANFYTTRPVIHPGIQARRFEHEIVDELGNNLTHAVLAAVQRALK